jgi:hypothetical protein
MLEIDAKYAGAIKRFWHDIPQAQKLNQEVSHDNDRREVPRGTAHGSGRFGAGIRS